MNEGFSSLKFKFLNDAIEHKECTRVRVRWREACIKHRKSSALYLGMVEPNLIP